MYRFSNGLTYTGSTEKAMAFLMFQSGRDNINFPTKLWKYETEKPEGNRIYLSKKYGRLQVFKKPLKDHVYAILQKELSQVSKLDDHPVFSEGFDIQSKRLFPDIKPEIEKQYWNFIRFLQSDFKLDYWRNSSHKKLPFSDDFGPYMLGQIGNDYFTLPELPPLYLAPKKWSEISWLINNYFSGPYPVTDKMPSPHFEWGGLQLANDYNTPEIEGLAYYLIANFILIYEAWMNRSSCDSLKLFVELVHQHKERPWQKLFKIK